MEEQRPLLGKGRSSLDWRNNVTVSLVAQSPFKGITAGKRQFNDILFAILFVFMIVLSVSISILAFSKGDPKLLIPSELEGSEYWFQDSVAKIQLDWDVFVYSFLFSSLLGIIWTFLLKRFTRLLIWLSMLCGFVGLICVGVYVILAFSSNVSTYLGIACFVSAALLLFVSIFLRKKVKLTAMLFQEACAGLQHQPAIFLSAAIVLLIFAAFVCWWILSFIYLYSIPGNTIQLIDGTNNPLPSFNENIRYLMLFQVFAFFWTTAFLNALFEMTVAGGISSWYFSRDMHGYDIRVGSPALLSLGRGLSKSFGSLAIGSLILALTQFLSFLLKQAKRSFKNRFLSILFKCLQCFLGCIQGIVKFVNKYAYIYIAMHGNSFFQSARGVFDLIGRNLFSAVVVDSLGNFLLLMGRIGGTAIVALLAATLPQLLSDQRTQIGTVSLVIIIVFSYIIFGYFSRIISTGVDTVFVCYMEDLDRNKTSPPYLSPALHECLQEEAAKEGDN